MGDLCAEGGLVHQGGRPAPRHGWAHHSHWSSAAGSTPPRTGSFGTPGSGESNRRFLIVCLIVKNNLRLCMYFIFLTFSVNYVNEEVERSAVSEKYFRLDFLNLRWFIIKLYIMSF